MRLALIGMSGTGKSLWSKRLAAAGFHRYGCDDAIEARLGDALRDDGGIRREMGQWLGFPADPGYAERQARYLALEIEVMTEILDELERDPDVPGNVVVDTTGSVIYTGGAVLGRLARLTRIVHMDTPPTVRRRMLAAYIDSPRPVLWGDAYQQAPGETARAALIRCYPALLESRERHYARWADVTVDHDRRGRPGFTVDDFIRVVGEG
mgnify:CR=1 FL=1